MSYIQIELGGKLRGFKFNMMSLEVFSKNINAEAVHTTSIYATFYAGLIGNCAVKREEPDFTFEDVCGWVDELYEKGRKEDIEKVCAVWVETHVYKNALKEFQDKIRAALEPDKEVKKTVKKKMK